MGPWQLIARIEGERAALAAAAPGSPSREARDRASRTAAGNAYVVANAYDADPGSPLSRTILLKKPDLVIEGLAIAASAVGATSGYIYLRPRRRASGRGRARFEAARPALGDLEVEIALGPGGFMGGEEIALLAVLESRRAMARQRPPYPAIQGLLLRPTVISSAETLAALPLIVRDGADAFRRIGTTASPGTKLVAVTGAVASPGVYESRVRPGPSARSSSARRRTEVTGQRELTERASMWAVRPAASSTPRANPALKPGYASLKKERATGTHLGSARVRVLGADVCIVNEAAKLFDYLARETCGICVPCRVGTKRVEGILEGIYSDLGRADDLPWLRGACRSPRPVLVSCDFGSRAPRS